MFSIKDFGKDDVTILKKEFLSFFGQVYVFCKNMNMYKDYKIMVCDLI